MDRQPDWRAVKPWWLPDSRGVIGAGVYALVLVVLGLMAWVPELRKDEFFKTIATLIVGAFIKDVVGWAYQATKGGGELAASNAAIVAQQTQAPTGNPGDPVAVKEEK